MRRLSHSHTSKTQVLRWRERERESTVEDEQLFLLLGFYTVLVEFYTEEVLRGFLPCGFPEEKYLSSCVFVLIVLSVILLVKNCFKISSKQLRKLNMVSEPP